MADTKISALTNLTGSGVATGDEFPIVDASAAETKAITAAEIMNMPTLTDTGSLITATSINGAFQEVFNGSAAVNVNAATGATETLTLAPVHKMTMDQNCTFTFPTPTTASHTFILHLIGAFTPTFPGSVDWASATAPTYATPAIFVFTTDDTGTTWFGNMVGSGFG